MKVRGVNKMHHGRMVKRFCYVLGAWLGLCSSQLVLGWYPSFHSKAHESSFTIYGSQKLSDELNQIIDNIHNGTIVGVYIKSMKSGKVLYGKNTNLVFTPASILKLLTAEAALLYLGAEYRFPTQLLTDAKSITNGILQGNLYIVLNGDPSLTYYDLVDLMVNLKSQQIQGISGNVYIDSTAYDQNFYGPGWDGKDKNYCYAAPISASIINHNCLAFKIAPAKESGHFAEVVTSPRYFYPAYKNSVVTKRAHDNTCNLHFTTDVSRVISLNGCVPKGPQTWGLSYVVSDIPDYDRTLFKNLFERLRMKVYGHVTFGSAGANLTLIATHQSEPLRSLINDMLKKSDNIIAGALFKKLGQVFSHQPGSWKNGSLAVMQILWKYAKLNLQGIRVVDGSGLSANNLISPQQIMQVLEFAYHHDETKYEFVSALPIAGVDGTLKHRMANITRKVRAKTGTIKGVVSLAGYAESADQDSLAFVIIINGMSGSNWGYRNEEDKIVTALTRYVNLPTEPPKMISFNDWD